MNLPTDIVALNQAKALKDAGYKSEVTFGDLYWAEATGIWRRRDDYYAVLAVDIDGTVEMVGQCSGESMLIDSEAMEQDFVRIPRMGELFNWLADKGCVPGVCNTATSYAVFCYAHPGHGRYMSGSRDGILNQIVGAVLALLKDK